MGRDDALPRCAAKFQGRGRTDRRNVEQAGGRVRRDLALSISWPRPGRSTSCSPSDRIPGHYCSPNAAYDRIVGINPGKCSRRDLIADLAKALSARNIRLMVYLPSGAPAADPVARKALGWRWGAKGGWQLPGEPVGGRLADFQRNWEAVIREWSLAGARASRAGVRDRPLPRVEW